MPYLRFDFPDSELRPAIFRDPVRVVRADALDEVIPALEMVRDAVADGVHAAGFVAYEAAPAFDAALVVRDPGDLPLLWFGLFTAPEGAANGDRADGEAAGDEGGRSEAPIPWELPLSRADHAAAVAAIHEAIAEGRTYQVNLTTRLEAPFEGDPMALYRRLRRAQGAGFHAYLDLGEEVVVSASPELFFRTRGREITTRPMKGTRPRGRWPEEDRALADALEQSGKDRAENLMIVDLIRNDLGRVCVPGGVRVPRLLDVEGYRTVWQMTSTVEGVLRDDVDLVDLFRALFPCGSVTGAPKISTSEVIARLEDSPREVYCGAIGWIRPGGDCAFSVPIRTAWIDRRRGRIRYGTGGGVVWDSTADAEYDELLAKTEVVRRAWPGFRLLETMGLRDGSIPRLDRHVARMAASAGRFGFPFPESEIRADIARLTREHRTGRLLVRITLDSSGRVAAEVRPLDEVGADSPDDAAGPPRPVALADDPVDSRDVFLFHKTTHRAVYAARRDAAPSSAFDVILRNERGEITELCRGNLVAEIDGRLLTPAVASGLLAGRLREDALESGTITEAVLTAGDLRRASRLWSINSARGWIPIEVADRPGETGAGGQR